MATSISEVTRAVEALLANPPPVEDRKDGEAEHLFDAMERLRVTLEKPEQTVNRIIFSCRTLPIIKIAQGMGIFDAFADVGLNHPLTLGQLDEQTKGDRTMLTRILRLLITEKVITKSNDEYTLAPFAYQFRNDTVSGEVVKHFHAITAIQSPNYLKARDYMSPDDAFDAPHQFANNTKNHYFHWLADDEERQRPFNATMSLPRHDDHNQWFDIYPVRERLNDESHVFVDLGGGSGHDIARLKTKFPDLPGRLVLQDLPAVVRGVSLPNGIEINPHNMFDPQPIKDARAYYMRTVLHDWPDKQALEVLSRVREAMGKDSILLINENVLSESGADDTPVVAHTDFTMMLNFSSRERTESEWIELLQKADLKLIKVWRPRVTIKSRALFEAMRVD
ncbi:hypothetical protein M409DRAFT_56846 [Zasmidium cellare ATCC 36951]|uniref:O-methyltransferase C-terminal domain-containing protein n=1 Tax=Zasmidium cellare ATCC 36951 TaxID=1080233 RepID=A0A6A6CEQ9_ZASCE|nr:uncharacterized protein M409DRAFT_56846 [Zasmidium cellare ATCC 36951]KAF2164139.1 hypothetical protein M409DRAFT_56846 [Zasmidium cellare ATCC 36951]